MFKLHTLFRKERSMQTNKYIVKVDTNGKNRAIVLTAIDELAATKKALALFRQAEFIAVSRLENASPVMN